MSDRPRVSVVIPAYQSEARIGRTLARLAHQRFRDFEVVVVNDGSTDDTLNVVRRASTNDSRIRRSSSRTGELRPRATSALPSLERDCSHFSTTMTCGIRTSSRFKSLDSTPARRPSPSRVIRALVDTDGRLLGWRLGGDTEGNVYREMLEWDMVSGGSVTVVRRAAVEAAGGFDVTLSDRADWDLWIRLARQHPFTCVPRMLVGYTRRAGSVSQSYDRMIEHGRGVLAKARADDPRITEAELAGFLARDLFGAACLCLADERPALALHYLTRAVRGGPGMVLGRSRRWGVIAMIAAASVLPASVYRAGPLALLSRVAFGIRVGEPFDGIANSS